MSAQLKKILLEAPDSMLDASVFPLIEKWDDTPTSLQVLEVLDYCVYSSLASEFVVRLLEGLLYTRLDAECRTLHEIEPEAYWREKFA